MNKPIAATNDHKCLSSSGSVLIDDWSLECRSGRTYLFTDPSAVILAQTPQQLSDALRQIDEYQRQGKYLAGYIAYDAGLQLDKPISSRHDCAVPLLWFGVYDKASVFDYSEVDIHGSSSDCIGNVRLNTSSEDYLESVARISEYIAAGDVYQVNYTCKILFENTGSALELFARLRKAHPVCHSAFINAGEFQIASLSPELFLRRTGNRLVSRPMKGTARRGKSSDEDMYLAQSLANDEKNRAENVMIVDLMRNDLGRVCNCGSVTAQKMFFVEQYRSVFQMTSEVSGLLKDGTSASEVISKTVPPGSITGAPKIRAMEIIDELETDSRGVYCGSIGMFSPCGDYLLNVAIRTIVQVGNCCELGVGSGIVADSSPEAELQETLLKGGFLMAKPDEFRLLETLLYKKGSGYAYMEQHLERISRSAEFYGWVFDKAHVITALEKISTEIEGALIDQARVRLLVSEQGAVEVQFAPLDCLGDVSAKLLLSSRAIDPENTFLYHKTTRRSDFDEDLRAARNAGYLDMIYVNCRGEVTECSTANIAFEVDGVWITPSVSCGLLPGIWRQDLLLRNCLTERVITPDEMKKANRIMIGNSVRGSIEIQRLETSAGEVVWEYQDSRDLSGV